MITRRLLISAGLLLAVTGCRKKEEAATAPVARPVLAVVASPKAGRPQTFAGASPYQITFGVNEPKCRPRVHAIALPDLHVGVVHDRVSDFIPENGLANALRVLLVLEFGRVHADNDQLVAVLLFQLGERRKSVDTVNATESPKIEEHDSAAQIAKMNGL